MQLLLAPCNNHRNSGTLLLPNANFSAACISIPRGPHTSLPIALPVSHACLWTERVGIISCSEPDLPLLACCPMYTRFVCYTSSFLSSLSRTMSQYPSPAPLPRVSLTSKHTEQRTTKCVLWPEYKCKARQPTRASSVTTAQHSTSVPEKTTPSKHDMPQAAHFTVAQLTVSLKTPGVGQDTPTAAQRLVRDERLSARTRLSHSKQCAIKHTGTVRTTRRSQTVNNIKRCAHCCAHLSKTLRTPHPHTLTPLPWPGHAHTATPNAVCIPTPLQVMLCRTTCQTDARMRT